MVFPTPLIHWSIGQHSALVGQLPSPGGGGSNVVSWIPSDAILLFFADVDPVNLRSEILLQMLDLDLEPRQGSSLLKKINRAKVRS